MSWKNIDPFNIGELGLAELYRVLEVAPERTMVNLKTNKSAMIPAVGFALAGCGDEFSMRVRGGYNNELFVRDLMDKGVVCKLYDETGNVEAVLSSYGKRSLPFEDNPIAPAVLGVPDYSILTLAFVKAYRMKK